MRIASGIPMALIAALALAAAAPAGAATKVQSKTFAGKTSDGLGISFRVVTTTTTTRKLTGPAKARKRVSTTTVTRQIAGVVVKVNSFCSVSGPRVFVASGGSGDLRDDGTFTARGGGVAVRGKIAGPNAAGTVTEFERFGSDVCRTAAYFAAS
jgi:hypothetical protein